jgi:hypothetical protein
MDIRSVEFLLPTFAVSPHQARLAMIATASLTEIVGQSVRQFPFQAEQDLKDMVDTVDLLLATIQNNTVVNLLH